MWDVAADFAGYVLPVHLGHRIEPFWIPESSIVFSADYDSHIAPSLGSLLLPSPMI